MAGLNSFIFAFLLSPFSRAAARVSSGDISKPVTPTTQLPEVTMCTMCDETMATCNPVPGMHTILSCAEGKVKVDNVVSLAECLRTCNLMHCTAGSFIDPMSFEI